MESYSRPPFPFFFDAFYFFLSEFFFSDFRFFCDDGRVGRLTREDVGWEWSQD